MKAVVVTAAAAVVVSAAVLGAVLLGGGTPGAGPDVSAGSSPVPPGLNGPDGPNGTNGPRGGESEPSGDRGRTGNRPRPTVEGWKAVVNSEAGVAFEVPAGWTLRPPGRVGHAARKRTPPAADPCSRRGPARS
ncbi:MULTISPECIES: hypothetical protein [Streptomyces]|uniref:hypothetical protein n=1 Tax=Streptomyces TaxID=1883 RepID=UPI001F210C69|nr:hypothetical protein [Streptomyces sp. AS58]